MSVLQILGSAGDGGAETYFLSLTRALARQGLAQACAIRPHEARQAELQAAGIPVATAPFRGPFDFKSRGVVRRLAREQGAKALIAWMSRAARFSPKGPWARIGRLGGYYDLKYYRGFDVLVGNTRDIQAWMIRKGWPEDKTLYIPNFAEPGPEPALARAALDTPEGVPLFLALGRLHESKAHDVALKAMAQLPDAWLWVAGSGPLEAELKVLAAELGVARRVRFLGWRTDASALYRAADACLFPSRYEPLGNVVIQAWAHGLPIVAAASKGPKDLISNNMDGLLVPVDDVDALVDAARRMIGESDLGPRLAEAGTKRVADEFSKAQVTAEWRKLLGRYGAA